MATTETKTWPTAADMLKATATLAAAVDNVAGFASYYTCHLVDTDCAPSVREGIPAPTFEDVGVLMAFIERLDAEAGSLAGDVTRLRLAVEAAAVEAQTDA